MDDVTQQVVAMIARVKQIEPDTITLASTFDELQVDSLDKINLTFEVEELYDIAIPDNSLSSLRTVHDVIEGVRRLRAEKLAARAGEPEPGSGPV
jgi:acyl carrier protein